MTRATILGIILLAGGCSKSEDSGSGSGDNGTRTAKTAPAAPAPAKSEPAERDDAGSRSREAIATVPGAALREWSRAQEVGEKRIKSSKIPDPVKAELATLGSGMLDESSKGAKGLRARWARIIGSGKDAAGATVAFSVGWQSDDPAGGTKLQLLFGVAVDDGTEYRVFERAGGQTHSDALMVDQWGFGKDRDADGDGVVDTFVTYDLKMDQTGGAFWATRGVIILGTRGAAVRIDLAGEDRGDADYHDQSESVVACWSTLDGRPALVQVTKKFDEEYKPKAPPELAATVYTADESGHIAEAKDRVAKTADKGAKAWRAIVGQDAKPRFVGQDVRETPDCPGTGEAVLAGGVVYRLK